VTTKRLICHNHTSLTHLLQNTQNMDILQVINWMICLTSISMVLHVWIN